MLFLLLPVVEKFVMGDEGFRLCGFLQRATERPAARLKESRRDA